MNVWDVFWFLFLFVPLAILWVIVLFDMMGRRDLVGWQKAIWAMVIVFFPWIGVFAYLIARPSAISVKVGRNGVSWEV
ncbi:MAG TPA: PLDc N-terminal domain-containing protein [Ktedonobacterales bacterium]